MVDTSSLTSWKALDMRSNAVASYLSGKSFLPELEWKSYKEEMRHLQKRLNRLSEGSSSLSSKVVREFQEKCAFNIRTIEVRLGFFQSSPTHELRHLQTRLAQVESQLSETAAIHGAHKNLLIPQGKNNALRDEFERLTSRIEALLR